MKRRLLGVNTKEHTAVLDETCLDEDIFWEGVMYRKRKTTRLTVRRGDSRYKLIELESYSTLR